MHMGGYLIYKLLVVHLFFHKSKHKCRHVCDNIRCVASSLAEINHNADSRA